MHNIMGLKIIADPNMGEAVMRVRDRSMKERLFSLPWHPMKKQVAYTVIVPDGNFYLIQGRGLVGHPEDIRELERQVANAA